MNKTFLIEKVSGFYGTPKDDAQYFNLSKAVSNSGKLPNVMTAIVDVVLKDKDKSEYTIYLKGETQIYDYKGREINKASDYLPYLEDKKKNKITQELYFNKKAFLEIKNKKQPDKYIGIYYNLRDCFKLLEEIEKQGESFFKKIFGE